jgi:hypothetical protein
MAAHDRAARRRATAHRVRPRHPWPASVPSPERTWPGGSSIAAGGEQEGCARTMASCPVPGYVGVVELDFSDGEIHVTCLSHPVHLCRPMWYIPQRFKVTAFHVAFRGDVTPRPHHHPSSHPGMYPAIDSLSSFHYSGHAIRPRRKRSSPSFPWPLFLDHGDIALCIACTERVS